MTPRPLLYLFLLLRLASAAQAEPEIACPGHLSVTATTGEVAGWQTVAPAETELPLEHIAIRPAPDGSASIPQTGFLRLEQGARKTILASWDLSEARATYPALWLACFYSGTTVALAHPIPPEVTACEYRVESTDTDLQETAACH